MEMEPGGYRFNDYGKLGIVVMAWYFIISVLLVPLIWRL
jgi:di/tricarboxylate transporter